MAKHPSTTKLGGNDGGGLAMTGGSAPSMKTGGTGTTADGSIGRSVAIGGGLPAAIVHHVTAGVAASDGDLMPVQFAGDQRCNAGEWARISATTSPYGTYR